jgi:hypothetical protein
MNQYAASMRYISVSRTSLTSLIKSPPFKALKKDRIFAINITNILSFEVLIIGKSNCQLEGFFMANFAAIGTITYIKRHVKDNF